MMRHTKASTTTDVYMQSLEPEVRSAINSIYDELMGNGTTGPVSPEPSAASGGPRSQNKDVVAVAAQEASKESHRAITRTSGISEDDAN